MLLKDCTSLPYMQHDPELRICGRDRRGTPVEILESGRLLRSHRGHGQYRISLLCRLQRRSQSPPARSQLGALCGQEPRADEGSALNHGKAGQPRAAGHGGRGQDCRAGFHLECRAEQQKGDRAVGGRRLYPRSPPGAATVDSMYRRPVRRRRSW